MTNDEIKEIMLTVLGEIAPEVDATELRPDLPFREQLDLDSMDFLNFVIGLNERLQVEIPETACPKLSSLAAGVEYLANRLAQGAQVSAQ